VQDGLALDVVEGIEQRRGRAHASPQCRGPCRPLLGRGPSGRCSAGRPAVPWSA
jgi:hypothetical protein